MEKEYDIHLAVNITGSTRAAFGSALRLAMQDSVFPEEQRDRVTGWEASAQVGIRLLRIKPEGIEGDGFNAFPAPMNSLALTAFLWSALEDHSSAAWTCAKTGQTGKRGFSCKRGWNVSKVGMHQNAVAIVRGYYIGIPK